MPINEGQARFIELYSASARYLGESASLLLQTSGLATGEVSDSVARQAPDAAIAAPDAAVAAPDQAVAATR